MNQKAKVIILTGPCGVGKTTLAKIIANRLNIELIDGDKIRKSTFPNVDYITKHPEKLSVVKEKIFELSKKYFSNNTSTIIDYVILGEDYLNRFRNEFQENLILQVLLPDKEIIYERDKKRSCWTSGEQIIDDLYQKYLGLVDVIGQENYLDNENQTAAETATKILANMNRLSS